MWETERGRPDGLFWQYDVRDGMEESISGSRTAKNIRPTINSYMAANARAIAEIAKLAGRDDVANEFAAKSDAIRAKMIDALWDEDAKFFKVRFENGGLSDAREAIGFIPWTFGLAGPEHAEAWKQLKDDAGFCAPCGLTTAERRHPQFRTHGTGTCEWDGAVWPFATSQTLTGLANVLRGPPQPYVSRRDYFDELLKYARSHQHERQAVPRRISRRNHRRVADQRTEGRAQPLLQPFDVLRPGDQRPGRHRAARGRHGRSRSAPARRRLGLVLPRRRAVPRPFAHRRLGSHRQTLRPRRRVWRSSPTATKSPARRRSAELTGKLPAADDQPRSWSSGTTSRPPSGPRRFRSATAGSARWSSAASSASGCSSTKTRSGPAGREAMPTQVRPSILPEIRRLLLAGKQHEAEELAMEHFMSVPLRQMAYQPFGDVELEFRRPRQPSTTIAARSTSTPPSPRPRTARAASTYTRQALASYPDRAIVYQVDCDQPGALAFAATHDQPA